MTKLLKTTGDNMAKTAFQTADEITQDVLEKIASRVDSAKIGTTPSAFRFLTPWGEDSLAVYGEHFVEFPAKKRAFLCPKFDGDGECLICDSPKGPGKGIISQSYGKKFLAYVIERNAEGDKIKTLRFGPALWGSLRAFVKDAEELGARDFNISSVKDKGFTAYIVDPVTKKATALTEEEESLIEKLKPIQEMIPDYDAETITKLMNEEPRAYSNGSNNGEVSSPSSSALDSLKKALADKGTTEEAPASQSSTLATLLKAKKAETVSETKEEVDDEDFFANLRKKKA
ncbi:MAG TPA: hypothetical protein VIH61_01125 [Waddliaceae bacterium]